MKARPGIGPFPGTHGIDSSSRIDPEYNSDVFAYISINYGMFRWKFARTISELIHLPGLRGNPERTYSVTAADVRVFAAPSIGYVASLIARWGSEDPARVRQ